MADTQKYVTFDCSGFNTSEPRDYFINPDNFGDDIARRVMQELQARNTAVDSELGQEDHGWYFTFHSGGQIYDFVLGYRGEEGAEWLGWLERGAGLLPSLFGARKRSVPPEIAQLVHAALVSLPDVQGTRWHLAKDFDAGNEDLATNEPAPR